MSSSLPIFDAALYPWLPFLLDIATTGAPTHFATVLYAARKSLVKASAS